MVNLNSNFKWVCLVFRWKGITLILSVGVSLSFLPQMAFTNQWGYMAFLLFTIMGWSREKIHLFIIPIHYSPNVSLSPVWALKMYFQPPFVVARTIMSGPLYDKLVESLLSRNPGKTCMRRPHEWIMKK